MPRLPPQMNRKIMVRNEDHLNFTAHVRLVNYQHPAEKLGIGPANIHQPGTSWDPKNTLLNTFAWFFSSSLADVPLSLSGHNRPGFINMRSNWRSVLYTTILWHFGAKGVRRLLQLLSAFQLKHRRILKASFPFPALFLLFFRLSCRFHSKKWLVDNTEFIIRNIPPKQILPK